MAEAVSRQFIARALRIYRWADNARVSKDETPFMYYLFGPSEIEDFLGTGDISPFFSFFRRFFRGCGLRIFRGSSRICVWILTVDVCNFQVGVFNDIFLV